MEEREYTKLGNDCLIYIKKILTKFDDKYIVIVMDYYRGWSDSDISYDQWEFKTEEEAIKFYNEE